ncbi:HNH endonuclease domain-containing protein [Clostridium cylindrosporum]|uniref:HNH endonuclease n=1 Tax=Clostridium cylindrosporum DSM 605 TaxID=1121307 RepID=A0A0J8D9J3_CLOCY|nr:HNH endonuclease domain-containing protein [Clostridium cylindrosporum]KMT22715.1 HNH endonuclease [Clostridium cylindrosporum DSM 605]
MINLPNSLKVESYLLERTLDFKNFSTSYKLFWFNGIYKEIIFGNKTMSFKKIIARMVATAWYPVIYYKLNLGFQDKLNQIILYVHETLKVGREENEEYIAEYIYNSTDRQLNKMINTISLYVPYRLIRPFYEEQIKFKEKITNKKISNLEINNLIQKLSEEDFTSLYRIDKKKKEITINDSWVNYITSNQAIINGWINFKLVYYLQLRNPNVPAIPFKIYPPIKRDLSKAKNFWKLVISQRNILDLYTNKSFNADNLEKYGSISVDHFIPWSFVLHDELWNLVPTFNKINSCKNNKLPKLDLYIDRFCDLQFDAFNIIRKDKKNIRYLEDYLTINKKVDINLLLQGNVNKEEFTYSIKSTIIPLYQIAYNQGYDIWHNNVL